MTQPSWRADPLVWGHGPRAFEVFLEPTCPFSARAFGKLDALLAGAWTGGQRGVLLMQSSGVGNCINMLSLIPILRFPFLTLITMRGDYGEFNSWQYPMGQGTPKVLEAMGVQLYSVDEAREVKATVDAATRAAFNGGQAVAVLLRQKLIGIKDFGKKTA